MSVLDNIKTAITLLEENEDRHDELLAQLSLADRKIDYWEHYIELEKIPVPLSYKILMEIKKQRLIRRQCKDELELLKVFRENEGKLCNTNNRKILLTNVCKTDSKHKNAQYNYDAYTEEELEEIFK